MMRSASWLTDTTVLVSASTTRTPTGEVLTRTSRRCRSVSALASCARSASFSRLSSSTSFNTAVPAPGSTRRDV